MLRAISRASARPSEVTRLLEHLLRAMCAALATRRVAFELNCPRGAFSAGRNQAFGVDNAIPTRPLPCRESSVGAGAVLPLAEQRMVFTGTNGADTAHEYIHHAVCNVARKSDQTLFTLHFS